MGLPWGKLTGIRPAKIARNLFGDGYSASKIEEIFLNRYQTDSFRAKLAVETAQKEIELMKNKKDNSISLYIGIPFCPSRCAYCSFISFSLEKSDLLMVPYLECLHKEITETAELLSDLDVFVETVYIGGGTPTTLSADQLKKLSEHIYKCFNLTNIKEFCVEAGRPDTITCDKLEAMQSCGVTRISINAQTMHDSVLQNIGRRHTVRDFTEAFMLARDAGFKNINTDVIAGLPGETSDMFSSGLDEIINLSPEDITVHTMSLKRASVINQNINGYTITDDETVGEMLDCASSKLRNAGYFPYYLYRQKNILGGFENTGFAKNGFECLYNMYIMEEVQTIISMGAGASTKIITSDDIHRIFNVKEPTEYIKRIDEMISRKKEILEYWNK